ncbi:hypothetical protein FRC98_13580 [Lujinxingia vulgaris]|uniref:Uncharacterized protein n=1 Tax=Lujinxingia vulgaris TaxID=2600176 RepID=A0A5C6X4T4_9DELT|nr:hypothetical protein [Lujinxingia vulgaris]TXD36148.1 hypothetical protein FRC98_13580 [Lujinxingia vulgaris]
MKIFQEVMIGALIIISSLGLTSCLTDNGCGRVVSGIHVPWEGGVSIFGVIEGGDVGIHPYGSSDMKLTMGSMNYGGPSIAAAQLSYWVDGEEVLETYQVLGYQEVESEDLLVR